MKKILVSGLINIETTLRIDQFPLHYFPVTYPFHGVQSTLSGVGYNLAKALTILGNNVNFLSLIGKDFYEPIIRVECSTIGVSDQYLLSELPQTAQSVIIYEKSGRRQIHTDLKDIQERQYPTDLFEQALSECDLCVLCNINFNRHMLEIARAKGKTIATDVHAIQDLNDAYNRDFMAAAEILFLSHEQLTCSPQAFIQSLWDHYHNRIIVVGLGDQGAMLGLLETKSITQIPAIQTRPILNTIGAGDALFSAFLHTYQSTRDPILSLQKAVLFSSFKIGCIGAAEGSIDMQTLSTFYHEYQHQLSPVKISF
ncbi:MAG: carbohydrate kinase family protein [Chloroflexi bacterium HGW-Chloroflexi-3]|nr:MAG: carbohydrate kinase family protein [Chloroflexi bacterium HGW-Chloroflexi-3]